MTVTSATNAYYKALGYENYGQQNQSNGSNAATAALKRAQTLLGSTEDASGTTGNSSYSDLVAILSQTLKGMGLSANDSVTFQTILQYRDKLSKAFESNVKEDLKKLGVDEKVTYQLVSGEKNGIEVLCADKETKQKIEKYFEDNPDRVKEFQQIQSLSNVESARKAQGIDPAAIRQRIQIESMTAWFAGTGQNTSSIMNFSGGEMSLYSGLNKKV